MEGLGRGYPTATRKDIATCFQLSVSRTHYILRPVLDTDTGLPRERPSEPVRHAFLNSKHQQGTMHRAQERESQGNGRVLRHEDIVVEQG